MNPNDLQRPPVNPARRPTGLSMFTLITEDEAVAECLHTKRFFIGCDVAVCCQCGVVEWTGMAMFGIDDAVVDSLYLFLSLQRALEHR